MRVKRYKQNAYLRVNLSNKLFGSACWLVDLNNPIQAIGLEVTLARLQSD